MRSKLAIIATLCSIVGAVASAAAMSDQARTVEIVSLFASGVGTGAGLAAIFVTRARKAQP